MMRKPRFYAVLTPIGEIRVYTAEGRPVLITLPGMEGPGTPAASDPPAAVARLLHALTGYFRGEEMPPGLAESVIDNVFTTDFERRVLLEAARIPRGETRSYGEVAELAGSPRAARAVGNAMHGNPFPVVIPCHRVIRSDGSPGGYGGAEGIKEWLLRFEGWGRGGR